jgi:hypothetical protein
MEIYWTSSHDPIEKTFPCSGFRGLRVSRRMASPTPALVFSSNYFASGREDGMAEVGGIFCNPAIEILGDVFSQKAGADQRTAEGTGELAGRLGLFEAFKKVDVGVVLPIAEVGEGGMNAGEVLGAMDLGFEFFEFMAFFRSDHG